MAAHDIWSYPAKIVEQRNRNRDTFRYNLSNQWDAVDLAKLQAEKRPASRVKADDCRRAKEDRGWRG